MVVDLLKCYLYKVMVFYRINSAILKSRTNLSYQPVSHILTKE